MANELGFLFVLVNCWELGVRQTNCAAKRVFKEFCDKHNIEFYEA